MHKLKMMLCVMMLPLVVVGCTSKRVCQSVREATTASGVDNAASLNWRTTAERIISPSKLITMSLMEGTQIILMSSAR